jgi:hypothetical protein
MERRCLLTMIRKDFVTENSDGRTVKANVLASSYAFLYTCKLQQVQFTLEQATKAQKGIRGITHLFF